MNKKYDIKINEIAEVILKNSDQDIIIIGDNSSGKSEILKKVIPQINKVYYIDSFNRSFNYKNLNLTDITTTNIPEILAQRLTENNFNLRDSFGVKGNIELFSSVYLKKLLSFLNEFLKVKFVIGTQKQETGFGSTLEIVVHVNDEQYENLSSGYQALIRIFAEIIYCTTIGDINTIIIDEINEFLSAKNEAIILPFLKEKFPNIRFIVTTHSADVISNSENALLIVLKNNDYQLLDGNDFKTNTSVRLIFEDIYFKNSTHKTDINYEDILRKLYNFKILNMWTATLEDELNNIDITKLSCSQKILLDDIKEF